MYMGPLVKKIISTVTATCIALSPFAIVGLNPAYVSAQTVASVTSDSQNVVIPAGLLTMELGSTGRIEKLIDSRTGKDYSPTNWKDAFVYIYLENRIEFPTTMTQEGNILTFTFKDGRDDNTAVIAKIQIEEKENYTNFELIELENKSGKDLKHFIWEPITVTIKDTIADALGVVYDSRFAVGLMGLNVKTVAAKPENVPDLRPMSSWHPIREHQYSAAVAVEEGGQLRAYTSDYSKDRSEAIRDGQKYDIEALDPAICGDDGEIVGSKVALYGCTPDTVLDIVGAMEVAEGMPHPTVNGEWQKDPEQLHNLQLRTEYLFPHFSTDTIDDKIYQARRLDAELMYGHDTFVSYDGDYRIIGFDTYEEFNEQIAQKAKDKGLLVGTKNRPAFVRKDLPASQGKENIKNNILKLEQQR